MSIYFNTKIKTISKRRDRRRAPVIQNIAYSAFNVSVLEAARFCYSYKDLDSGAKNTFWKGRCPCFCFIDSLTMPSMSTHGTLGFFRYKKFLGFFSIENPGKETHVLEVRNCQLTVSPQTIVTNASHTFVQTNPNGNTGTNSNLVVICGTLFSCLCRFSTCYTTGNIFFIYARHV